MPRLNRRCNFINMIRDLRKSCHCTIGKKCLTYMNVIKYDFAERGLSKRALITHSHAVMNDVAER